MLNVIVNVNQLTSKIILPRLNYTFIPKKKFFKILGFYKLLRHVCNFKY